MDLESLKAKGIKPHIMIDACDFMDYCINKHGYTNNTFHDEIWNYMYKFFENGEPYACFYKSYNSYKTKNQTEEMIDNFLNDFPEFGDEIKIMSM